MAEKKVGSQSYIKMAYGYGIVSRTLMTDQKIDIKGKAIYALLCSYAGSEEVAFPSVDTILRNLGISKDTYYKHMKQLRLHGYIEVGSMPSDSSKFTKNVYTIIPCPNSSDTENSDTKISYAANQDTNNNNTTINNLNNNNTKSPTLPKEATDLSKRLFNWIKKNYPHREQNEKDIKRWAIDIDKIHRIDGKKWEDIAKVIDWSQKDEFWHQNIKSGAKLRKQYLNLEDKMWDKKKPYTQPIRYPDYKPEKKEPEKPIVRATPDSPGYKQFEAMKKKFLEKSSMGS